MKKAEISVLLALILVVCIGNFQTFSANCEEIRENTLRLHIRANSDSEEDQNLKLKVRDEITKKCSHLFENSANEEEAKEVTKENLEEIKKVAETVIAQNGYQYKVEAQVVNMYFETRKYENFTMPAGYYDAVTVNIGTGEGKNWWCVLYPPLCVPSAVGIKPGDPNQTQEQVEKEQDKLLEDAFGKEKKDMIKNQNEYEYKFALIEAWEKLKSKFK